MDQLKAFLAAVAPFLGKRLFAWAAAAAGTIGVALPWDEAKVVAFVVTALSLAADGAVYWWRHRNDKRFASSPARNRALLVGINAYPGAPLRGCVNDAKDNAAYLKKAKGFRSNEIVMLLDKQATTANILAGLKWVAADYQTGDKRFFAYSGHGTQMPGSREKDGKFECICPYDFDWSEAHVIRDTDFAKAFGGLPKGAVFDWVSDSCFSGGLADVLGLKAAVRSRSYPVPEHVAERLARIQTKPKPLHKDLNVGFLSGCRSDQTSADADIDGRSCGAFTHYWLARLDDMPNVPHAKMATLLRHDLADGGFDQRPVVDGARSKRPFLQ